MKKLLSAIWAKALAFLLTPLAGVAAVNGVSEVIMVYFYDVWSPHPVWLLVVTVLCAVVAVGSLLFSLSAAGHWPGHEGIHLTWLDRIPLDVFVLALAGEWLIYGNASYYPSSVLGMVVFVALAYLFILAFTARCKAGIVLADLVVLRLLRLLSRGAVWAWRHLRVLVLGYPKNMDGTLGPRAEKAAAFGETLKELTGLPLTLWDERRTTIDAHNILFNNGQNAKKRKKTVDAVAAALMLEGYLTRKRLEAER